MGLDRALRDHLRELLTTSHAHIDLDDAIAGLPDELRGVRPSGVAHTPWQLVEHLRIVLWDILQFSKDPNHVSPTFPEGYWPEVDAPPDPEAWNRSLQAFRADMQAMIALVQDTAIDLIAPIPHGDGQTILREALLVADHNAYHIGQLMIVRKLLGA